MSTVASTPKVKRPGVFGDQPTRSRRTRTRSRSKSLITLAALLVLGFGLATAFIVTRAGDKVSVLVMGAEVSKGQIVDRSDLVSQSVSGVAGAIPIEQVDTVAGRTATVDMVKGQLLTQAMVTDAPTPAEGESIVGLSLDPTRVPSAGLDSGDVVDLIAVPGGEQGGKAKSSELDAPVVLAAGATVYAVDGGATTGGQILLTVVVADDDANQVAAYSTGSRVAVVEVTAVRKDN